MKYLKPHLYLKSYRDPLAVIDYDRFELSVLIYPNPGLYFDKVSGPTIGGVIKKPEPNPDRNLNLLEAIIDVDFKEIINYDPSTIDHDHVSFPLELFFSIKASELTINNKKVEEIRFKVNANHLDSEGNVVHAHDGTSTAHVGDPD